MLKIFFITISLLFIPSVFSQPLSVEYFSKRTKFSDIKISPTGKYISAVTDHENKNVLTIFDRNSFKILHVIYFPFKAQVGDYHWVNENRVVVSKQYIKGWKDTPIYYGELFAVNADGGHAKYIAGYNIFQPGSSRLKKNYALKGTSHVLDPLPHDPDHLLISVHPWSQKVPYTVAYKVNVYTGKRKKITSSPAKLARYLTDNQGHIRFSISSADFIKQDLYLRDIDSGKWEKLNGYNGKLFNITPYAFDQSGNNVYATANKDNGPKGLYKLSLADNSFELISQNQHVSPSYLAISQADKSLYAVEYDAGKPEYDFINSDSTMVKRFKAFLQALPDHHIRITSSTIDGSTQIIWAGNDKNPGDYFIFDGKNKKLSYLMSERNWIDPAKMADVMPISFQSRDGITIHGYLTLPKNKKIKNVPLVVMPHGGPHGVRDWWSFNSTAQMFANHNIATLQINFRGSGGYGPDFEQAGYRKWGAEVQYDIIDGVNYLIEQKIADPDNICIKGGSFGGYSALQSAILAPDLFKCSVGEFGVYDLPLLFKEGDIPKTSSGIKYLKRVLGQDEKQLNAYSPTKNIEKLKTPLLIIHGAEDERAPIEQAEALIAALNTAQHPYEYYEFSTGGHGLNSNKLRLEYYEKVLHFIKKHLKTDT